MEIHSLCAYELERQRNIERQQELLAQLGLSDVTLGGLSRLNAGRGGGTSSPVRRLAGSSGSELIGGEKRPLTAPVRMTRSQSSDTLNLKRQPRTSARPPSSIISVATTTTTSRTTMSASTSARHARTKSEQVAKRPAATLSSEEFEVGGFVGSVVHEGEILVRTRWAGYDSLEDTYQPLDTVVGLPAFGKFLKEFGNRVVLDVSGRGVSLRQAVAWHAMGSLRRKFAQVAREKATLHLALHSEKQADKLLEDMEFALLQTHEQSQPRSRKRRRQK
ncbi:Cell division cycle-associated 7-like protein [Savitreella phatthalungensis]